MCMTRGCGTVIGSVPAISASGPTTAGLVKVAATASRSAVQTGAALLRPAGRARAEAGAPGPGVNTLLSTPPLFTRPQPVQRQAGQSADLTRQDSHALRNAVLRRADLLALQR